MYTVTYLRNLYRKFCTNMKSTDKVSLPGESLIFKPSPDSSLDSEDDYRSGSQNVSHTNSLCEDYLHPDDHTKQTSVISL